MSDLAARAQKRAEEMKEYRAAASAGAWGTFGEALMYGLKLGVSQWITGLICEPGSERSHRIPELGDNWANDAEFIAYAANTASENADLLTALADRVDEQERRIKELEAENERLRSSFAREVRRADCFGMERFMLAMLCADTPYFKDEQSIAAAKKIRDEALEALSQKGGE